MACCGNVKDRIETESSNGETVFNSQPVILDFDGVLFFDTAFITGGPRVQRCRHIGGSNKDGNDCDIGPGRKILPNQSLGLSHDLT